MHVALSVLCGTTGGPATYGRQLVAALRDTGEVRLTVLTDRPEELEGSGYDVVHLPMRRGADRLRWQYWALPRALRGLKCDLYHDTKNALPHLLPMPSVVTVHDLAYYRRPEGFGRFSRAFLRGATSGAVARARLVIVPSQSTAADVADIYPRHAHKTRVVPHGIEPHRTLSESQRQMVVERYGLNGPFVLHAGTIQARKNVHLLVQAVRKLRSEGFPHRCVLVGRRGWLAAEALAEVGVDDTALWLGVVPRTDLEALYELADLFVSPSAYEGFGLTVADALAAGTPTVISDVSSLPEICGPAAARIRELTVDGTADAMRPLLNDSAERQRLGVAGRHRAAEFRWDKAAGQTLEVYREALQGETA